APGVAEDDVPGRRQGDRVIRRGGGGRRHVRGVGGGGRGGADRRVPLRERGLALAAGDPGQGERGQQDRADRPGDEHRPPPVAAEEVPSAVRRGRTRAWVDRGARLGGRGWVGRHRGPPGGSQGGSREVYRRAGGGGAEPCPGRRGALPTAWARRWRD